MKKITKSSHKVQIQERDYSDTESEVRFHTTANPTPRKTWNPPAGLKFPCPVGNHKHEVSMCPDFFNFSPMDRWEKIEPGRMCYTCLKTKKCVNLGNVITLQVSLKSCNAPFVRLGQNLRVLPHLAFSFARIKCIVAPECLYLI